MVEFPEGGLRVGRVAGKTLRSHNRYWRNGRTFLCCRGRAGVLRMLAKLRVVSQAVLSDKSIPKVASRIQSFDAYE